MELKRFPFVVSKRRVVVVAAPTLSNAIDRVLFKHPNKFITTNYAKNVAKHFQTMDLISAQKAAKEQSKAAKGTLVFVILEGEEFIVKDYMEVDREKEDVYSIWRDGAKYEDSKQEQQENKTENKMEAKTKKSSAKKSTKKAAPKRKKVTPKKEKAAKKLVAVKKAVYTKPDANGMINPTGRRAFIPGKVVDISVGEMLEKMAKGYYYRDPQGVIQGKPYLSTRPRQDKVRVGMHEYKEGK